MALKSPDGPIVLSAGPERKREVFYAPDPAWLTQHDITLDRVQERLDRWWKTMASSNDRERRFLRDMKAAWPVSFPDRLQEFLSYNDDAARLGLSRGAASAVKRRDIDDYEGNLPTQPWEWMKRALTRDEMRLIRLVSLFGPAYVAAQMSKKRQQVHARYRDAVLRCWNEAIKQAQAIDAKTHRTDQGDGSRVRLPGPVRART